MKLVSTAKDHKFKGEHKGIKGRYRKSMSPSQVIPVGGQQLLTGGVRLTMCCYWADFPLFSYFIPGRLGVGSFNRVDISRAKTVIR
ncbi:hypothetical protein CEXT_731971 [Caerostris extrusa]|uniref:Uncharacterized protein n=1 Tax=Caerostris extrusa TaxID=172846 RepID=A0AAV4NGF7_CAEEX|nr:hypothetical protein CEXT_731971 [Caerostris extrusa]